MILHDTSRFGEEKKTRCEFPTLWRCLRWSNPSPNLQDNVLVSCDWFHEKGTITQRHPVKKKKNNNSQSKLHLRVDVCSCWLIEKSASKINISWDLTLKCHISWHISIPPWPPWPPWRPWSVAPGRAGCRPRGSHRLKWAGLPQNGHRFQRESPIQDELGIAPG